MEIKQQSKLSLIGIDIFHVSFISKQPYNGKNPVNLELSPKVFYPEGRPENFDIIIEASITSIDYYELSVAIAGKFSIDSELSDSIKKAFINTNAPAILFPYLRSFVSTFTSNLGTTAGIVTIPPHFFKGELEVLEEDNGK